MSRIPNVGQNRGPYYHIDDLCESEVDCIKILEFKLNYFTSYHFLETILDFGVLTEEEATFLKNGGSPIISSTSRTPGVYSKPYKSDLLEQKNRSYSNNSNKVPRKDTEKNPLDTSLDKFYDMCHEILETSIDSKRIY